MRAMSAKLPDGIARFILCEGEDNNMSEAKMKGGECL